MAAQYRIRDGQMFVMPDNSLKVAGEVIELPEDLAATHAGKLDPVPATKVADELEHELEREE